MEYLLLIGSVLFIASDSIFGGIYNKLNVNRKGASSLFTLLKLCTAFIFWSILFICDHSMNAGVIIYSVLFALCFALCCGTTIRALRTGPILLTSLFMQLSLIGTTIWGFFFWGSSFTPLVAVGLVLVCISIFLCLYNGKSENSEQKINLKWIIYVILMFVSNAGCSIVQKTEQIKFDGNYGNFMMWIASGLSVIIGFILYLKDDRTESKLIMKTTSYIPVISGICNGLLNLFVIILATSTISPSLIYPVIGVGSLIITTLFSAFVFKEKMHLWQWFGIVLGMIAVALLSI